MRNRQTQIYGSDENPISYISFKDVAKFAVESLGNAAATDKILELGGPDKISQFEAVEIFEKMGGEKFTINFVSKEALETQRNEAADPMQKSFPTLMLCVANGDPIDMSEMKKDFPLHLMSVSDFAAQHAFH